MSNCKMNVKNILIQPICHPRATLTGVCGFLHCMCLKCYGCMLHAWGKGTIKMPCPPRNTALQQDEVVSQEEMFECQDESFTVNHQKKKILGVDE